MPEQTPEQMPEQVPGAMPQPVGGAVLPVPTAALPVPTQDERTMAVLAHALQVIGGWIAPLIIFFVKPDSKFVRFHALQVLLLHILWVIVWIGMMFVWIAVMLGSIFGAMAHAGNHPNQMPFPVGIFFFFPFIWLFAMAFVVFELVLAIMFAIKAGRGEWAEYPLLGRLSKRMLHIA